MKKAPLILILFCAVLSWSLDAQAMNNDFDDYEATMASLASADKQAQDNINFYYAPLDVHVPLPREEDDSIMERIIAESLKTAAIEEVQREVDAVKEESIHLNNKIGELTRIVDERQKAKDDALNLYLDISKDDPEIEAMEMSDEKTRRLKERQERKAKTTEGWLELCYLYTAAKKDLEGLEEKENIVGGQFLALSEKLRSLKELD